MKHFDVKGFSSIITKYKHVNIYACWNMQYISMMQQPTTTDKRTQKIARRSNRYS
jgi:hypothetical protein